MTAGLRITGLVASTAGLVGYLAADPLAGLLSSDDGARAEAASMLRILAVAVPLFALSQGMIGASRGFATMGPSVLAGQIVRPGTQLILVLAVVVLDGSLSALALAWAVSAGLTLAVIATWLRRRLARVRDRAAEPGSAADGDVVGSYRRFAAGRAGADLVSAALERLDVILVAAFLGEAGAGLYGAAGRLILAGQLLMIAASQSMAPLLTAAFSSDRNDDARHLLRTITGWNVTLLWPVFLCLAIGAPTALSVFGDDFTDGAPLVVVLSATMLAIVAIGGGDTLLISTGDSLASLLNHVVALAVLLVAASALLPTVGVVGAAWAWALSRLTLRLLATARVWRTRGVHAFGRPVLLATVAAAVAYLPIGLAANAVLGAGWTAVAVNVGLGGSVHLAALVRLRRELELDRFVAVVARRA